MIKRCSWSVNFLVWVMIVFLLSICLSYIVMHSHEFSGAIFLHIFPLYNLFLFCTFSTTVIFWMFQKTFIHCLSNFCYLKINSLIKYSMCCFFLYIKNNYFFVIKEKKLPIIIIIIIKINIKIHTSHNEPPKYQTKTNDHRGLT